MKTMLICFLTFFVSTAKVPGKITLKADKTESSITYHCVHPLHEWDGVNKNVICVMSYQDSSNVIERVAMLAKVADFDTQNSNRDSHALEVLDGIKYPNVTFSSTSIVADGKHLKVSGNLTFHNETRPISFDAQREDADKKITVTGNFSVLLSDYKIARPSFMLKDMDDKMGLAFVMVFHR
jgi:polyisoprenoid-binding protein YceI